MLTPALIGFAQHNISPPLKKQLVREVEGGVGFSENRNGLPGSIRRWQTCPFHKNMPNTTRKLGAQHPFWMKERLAMKRRQTWL